MNHIYLNLFHTIMLLNWREDEKKEENAIECLFFPLIFEKFWKYGLKIFQNSEEEEEDISSDISDTEFTAITSGE